MELIVLVIIALICEAVWETLKMVWQEGKLSIDRIGALVIGLLIAFVTNCDLFKLINIPVVIPYVGIVLTGILVSRGANFVHDLLNKLQNSVEKNKTNKLNQKQVS
jgi:hypothetical protein